MVILHWVFLPFSLELYPSSVVDLVLTPFQRTRHIAQLSLQYCLVYFLMPCLVLKPPPTTPFSLLLKGELVLENACTETLVLPRTIWLCFTTVC